LDAFLFPEIQGEAITTTERSTPREYIAEKSRIRCVSAVRTSFLAKGFMESIVIKRDTSAESVQAKTE